MAILNKIDSNVTGLRIAEEESYKVLPGTPVWDPMEPNSYSDFGGSIVTTPRNPINAGRQRKKGTTTDLEAMAGWENDLTQTNLQKLLQGFFFATLRRKPEYGDSSGVITAVAAADDSYAGTGINTNFVAGDLIFASGFTTAANNGLKTVASVSAGKVLVSEALTTEASPPAAAKITAVGFQATTGDIDVVVSGAYPTLTSTTLDFTTLGLIPGEWIFVGGDSAGTKFTTAANNGFARVRSIAANVLTLDKTQLTMVTEANTTATIRLFLGRVLKNETGTSIVRRTYQCERTLGAPDTSSPSDVQSEYVIGCVPNEFSLKIPSADKVMADLTFVGADVEQRTAATGVKSGTRPALVEADAFNTSSDFSRIKLSLYSATDAAPTALFAFVQDITLNVTNNVSGNKAVGVLGNFEATAGTFEVGGDITAYFANVEAVSAVRNNSNVTLDILMAKSNAGIAVDVPLLTLGDGKPDVQQDEAITLPLSVNAATGALLDTNLDHTLLMVFWDYLPTAADT
jgi:hypothetical protein